MVCFILATSYPPAAYIMHMIFSGILHPFKRSSVLKWTVTVFFRRLALLALTHPRQGGIRGNTR